MVHIRFSTATVDDRWESEYLAASQAAAGMIPFGDKIRDKYLRCIIDISVIPSGSDTMSSHIYTYILWDGLIKTTGILNAQSFPKERLALHGFEVVVPAKEEDRRLGGTTDAKIIIV